MEIAKQKINIKILKTIFVIFIGTILLTLSAKIKIPFYPVPMTMQTFIVLLMGIAFGWKISVLTVSTYLLEGIVGLPVFAGTPEKGIGLIYFTGPTMGYLIGFLVATFFAGYINFQTNFFFNFYKTYFLCCNNLYFRNFLVRTLNWLGQTNIAIRCNAIHVSRTF